jgi:iron complex outermembrane recepter protein
LLLLHIVAATSLAQVAAPAAIRPQQVEESDTAEPAADEHPHAAIRDVLEVDRVTVTGTYITSDSPPFVPETTYNREGIERSGARTLGDFVQQMPQNSGPTFTENQHDSLSPGAAAVALRGLTPDATLVLVNGRRVAPYPFAQGGITAFVDLNSLPLAAIQQIDILRDGASALYGSDAIAGVVNVRFLQRFDGALASFGYGNTTDTDVREFRTSLVTGLTNEKRGTELVLVADFFDRAALMQTDRYFSESTNQTRLGGSSFLSSVANPGTVFDPATGNPLRVPANSTGRPRVQDFRPGRNRFDRAPFQPLVPETQRYGVFSRVKVQLATAIGLFAEFGYRNSWTRQQLAPAPIEGDVENIAVPATNPFNPFGAPVLFRYRVTEAGPRVDEVESHSYRAVTGLTAKLSERWNAETALLFSGTETTANSFNNLSRPALLAALADPNPATAFNVFGAGNNINNPATIQSLLVTTTREGESRLFAWDAKADGPLFSLPAGELLSAFGVEYRYEELSDRFDPFATAGNVVDLNSTSAAGDRQIYGAFAELYAPLVSTEMGVPLVHKLEGQFAVRAESYSDFGEAINPKIGLAWRPAADWLLLRGSWSTGFRAPSLVQSSTGSLTFSQELRDTRRFAVTRSAEDESSSLQIVSGGNPNLDAEDSTNFSAGMVLTPPKLPGLTFTADAYRIEIKGSIASLDPQFILDNEDDFSGLVVRAPASAEDIALGIPGDVLVVNTRFQNLGFIRAQGLDTTLEYIMPPTPFGVFTLRAEGAYLHSFQQQASDAEPVRELAGKWVRPRFRGRAQAGWRLGGFEAITTLNYIHSYEDITADRRVDYSTTVDLLLEYRFGKSTAAQQQWWLNGLAVRAGVRNLFDDAPPFSNNTAGYPVPLEDPRQRFVFFDIEKKLW